MALREVRRGQVAPAAPPPPSPAPPPGAPKRPRGAVARRIAAAAAAIQRVLALHLPLAAAAAYPLPFDGDSFASHYARRLGALLSPALGAIDEAAAEGRIAEVGEAMAEVSAAAETIASIAFDASSEGTEVCQLVP